MFLMSILLKQIGTNSLALPTEELDLGRNVKRLRLGSRSTSASSSLRSHSPGPTTAPILEADEEVSLLVQFQLDWSSTLIYSVC